MKSPANELKVPFGLSLSKPSRKRAGEPFDRLRANGKVDHDEKF